MGIKMGGGTLKAQEKWGTPPKDKGEMGDPTHTKENGTKDQGKIADSLETRGKVGGDPKHKRTWGGGALKHQEKWGTPNPKGNGVPKNPWGKGGSQP